MIYFNDLLNIFSIFLKLISVFFCQSMDLEVQDLEAQVATRCDVPLRFVRYLFDITDKSRWLHDNQLLISQMEKRISFLKYAVRISAFLPNFENVLEVMATANRLGVPNYVVSTVIAAEARIDTGLARIEMIECLFLVLRHLNHLVGYWLP